MTIHDSIHLHEHHARLDRIAAARAHRGAMAGPTTRKSLRATLSAFAHTVAGRRAGDTGAIRTRGLAHVRGR